MKSHILLVAMLSIACLTCPVRAQTAPVRQDTVSPVASTPAASEKQEPAEYRPIIEQALREYEASNFGEARALFRRASDLFPNARTSRGLGMVEFELRNYGASIGHLEAALASSVRPLEGSLRAETEQLLSRARQYVDRVTLDVEPSPYQVIVDGVSVAVPPDGTLLLEIGRHAVEIHGEHRQPVRRVIAAQGGAHQVVRVVLPEEPAKVPPRKNPVRDIRRPFAAAAIPPWTTNHRPPGVRVTNHFGMIFLYDDPEFLSGLQLSWGGNGARIRADGVQIAGVFDYAEELRGVQTSLGFRYATKMTGMQLGLGPNAVTREAYGTQLASINWAKSIHGAQLGFINAAQDVRGVQVGGLNVASGRVHGVQLGLFNYADEADVSLAPIGITRKGGVHAQLSTSDTAMATLALRLDANYNYTFLAFGWHPLGNDIHRSYSVGAGMGAKIPAWKKLFVDLDLGVHLVQRLGRLTSVPSIMPQARAMLRVELHKHFSVFAGPTFNLLVQPEPDNRVRPGFTTHTYYATSKTDEVRVLYWPGWVAGLRF